MTDLDDVPYCVLDDLTRPSTADLVRLFPERAYVQTIPWSEYLEEERLLEMVLQSHPEWESINLWNPVADIFEARLWALAQDHGIHPDRTAFGRNRDDDLEIVFVFASEAECMHFKLALP